MKKTRDGGYELVTTHICMTKDIGVHGNLFGGIMLAWIDEAASVYACFYCDTANMVTLKVSELMFKQPVKVGDLVKFYAKPLKIGSSSITMEILAMKHNPTNGKEKEVLSTELVFVRIDSDGHSTPIDHRIMQKFRDRNPE